MYLSGKALEETNCVHRLGNTIRYGVGRRSSLLLCFGSFQATAIPKLSLQVMSSIYFRERDHMAATVALGNDDAYKAGQIWEDILVDHPKDAMALQLLFFTHLHTGRVRGLRDSVYRVKGHFPEGDRYYG